AESAAITAANSSGVPPAGSSPIVANRSRKVDDAIARLMAALSLSTIGRGTPAGAGTPPPGPAPAAGGAGSAGLGGAGGRRRGPLPAGPRPVPAAACGAIELRLSNIRCTRPAIRSLMALAPPRYGTCTMSVLVMNLNNSPPTWPGEPLLDEAFNSLPGFCLA